MKKIICLVVSVVIYLLTFFFRLSLGIIREGSSGGSSSTMSNTTSSGKRIPSSVQFGGKSYNVSEGWAGSLNLSYDGPVKYKAHPTHVDGWYEICDLNGNKVGDLNTN